MRQLTLGSMCDGLGGWCLAAIRNGIKPIWSSEIDKNCLLIEKRHFPDVKQLGDLMGLTDLPPVDIICAGTPCQSFSLAGKRKGMAGQSGLFLTAIRLVYRMLEQTNGEFPKLLVWENVPGVYSSKSDSEYGEGDSDFRRVIQEITKADIPMPKSGRWAESGLVRSPKCDVAWRCLDAQYWGVPQRRNRVFLIADFRQGGRCPEVLFIEPSLPRDSEPSGEAGQTSTGSSESGTDETSYIGHDERSARITENKTDPLTASDYKRSPVITDPNNRKIGALCAGDDRECGNQYYQQGKYAIETCYDPCQRRDVIREYDDGKSTTITQMCGSGGGYMVRPRKRGEKG